MVVGSILRGQLAALSTHSAPHSIVPKSVRLAKLRWDSRTKHTLMRTPRTSARRVWQDNTIVKRHKQEVVDILFGVSDARA